MTDLETAVMTENLAPLGCPAPSFLERHCKKFKNQYTNGTNYILLQI